MTEKRIKSSLLRKKVKKIYHPPAQCLCGLARGLLPRRPPARSMTGLAAHWGLKVNIKTYQIKPPAVPDRPMARGLSSKSVTGTDQMREEKPRARTTATPSVKDSTTQENPLKRTISLILIMTKV